MGPNSKIKTGSPVRSPRTLNSWLLFAAIGIIAVVSFFYWFVYIENNRDKQISKRFRVLAQMGQNIYERERILGGSANTAVDIGIQATLDTGLEPDSLHESRHESRLNLIKREIKDAKSLKVDKIDSITKAKVFEMADFSGGKDDELYTIYIWRKDFFAPLERPDVFDELIVLEDKNEQDDTGKMVTNSSVLYDTFPGDLDISNFKQLKTEQDEAGGIGMSTVTIWGKSYKLFLQPLVLDDGRKWYIGGMTGSAKFKRQVQALNSDIIILLLMGFLIFLFSIPLLKLYLMRTFDQLDRFDALLTSVSVVGCTLLLILFNMILYQNYHDNRIIDSNLQGLGQKVQENFIEELNDAYKTLEKFNNETKPDLRAYDKVTNLLSHPQLKNTLPKNTIPETMGFEDAKEPGFDAKSLALDKAYNLFKIVFWMDDTGQQIALLTTRNDSGSFSALGHRSYFKDAGNWVLPPDPKHPLGPTEEERGFMLESITSITSGEKLAAISMKSTAEFPGTDVSPTGEKIGAKRSRAAAMTTQLTSVIDTVMPVGYGFCIIDETGKVWFHSNTEQNLQENFIREVGEDSQLISAVQGHRKRDLTLNYQSKRHRCRVIPLEDIPLFLVVFHDTAYTESSQVGTILNTSFFMMTLIFFTSLIFLAIGVFNYNKSLLKQRYIYFDWLRPQITADSKGTYIHLSTSNGLIILFLLIFNFSAGRFETLFLCLSALLFSFTYNYYTMARLHDSANKMTAKRFRLNDKRLLVFLSIFLLLIDFIALVILKLPALLLVVSQVTILACLFLMKQSKAKPEPLRVQSDPGVETVKTTAQWYSFFLFSWLAVTYIVPMLMIYNHAYNDESEIARKYSQVKLAQDIQQRNDAIDKFYNERMAPEGESTSPPKKTGKDGKNEETLLDNTRKRRKERGIYSNPVGDVYCKNQTHVKDKFQSASTISPAVFNDADYYLRVPYDPIAREKRNLVYPNASDHSRTWKKMGVKLYLKYKVENSLNNRQAGHDPSIYINSTSRYFLESLEGIPFLIVLLVLVATLVLTYFLMYFEARRVFGLNLMGKELMGAPLNEVPKSDKTGDPILYRVRELVEVGSDAAILCQNREQLKRYITLSGDRFVPQTGGDAGDRSTINYRFKDINFAELAPAEEKDNKNAEKDSNGQTLPIIRINNFELDYHNIDNSENLEKDLRRVEELLKLLETPGIRVIIPMIQPLPEIIALYHQGFAGLPVKGKKDEKPQEMRQLEVTVEKLTRRLNEADKFLIPLVVPLKFENEPAPVYKKINAIAEPSIKQMILNEFKPSSYFKSIEAAVYRYYKRLKTGKFNKELEPGELEEVEAKIILEIQELARLYYYKLLKSCTRHEKFVLYDIAQDMLINPNSRETTTILLKKGLLVYDGTFKFMNESFRNYILSTIDTEEARQLIGGLSLQGRWKTYKAPIYLLIFGAVVFFAFQRELMSDLDAVITTLVGGVAILTKFSGVLSGLSFGKKK